MRAFRAALAAAACRQAQALHTTLHSQLEEAFRPSDISVDFSAEGHAHVPANVLDDLDERRRQLERLQNDTESGAPVVGAVAAVKERRIQRERSLWLSGKFRNALTNYNDVQYVGFMEVGGQTIAGIFDTGSFDLVVFSNLCSTCGQAGRYDPGLSANHTQGRYTSNMTYGSGTVVTEEAFDTVSFGPYAPRIQSFLVVTDADMPVLSHSTFQAIVGLGPPETPLVDAEHHMAMMRSDISSYSDAGLEVPSDLVKSEAQIEKVVAAMQAATMMLETFESRMFSVCLGRQPNSNGYFIWSDTAPLVKPEYFKRMPVMGNHTWSVTLDEPRLAFNPASKDRQFDRDNKYEGLALGCENGCAALLDTGTSLIGMPGTAINEFSKLSFEPGFNCSNMWELPSIKLKLGGHEVILPPDAYVSEVANDEDVPQYLQSFVRIRHIRLGHAKDQGLQHLGSQRGSQDLGHRRGAASQRPGAHCDLAVMESRTTSDQGPLWILGVPFFRAYYTTFEVSGRSNRDRAVHIAKASDTCHPAPPEESAKFLPRTQLYKRIIDPTKLWVAPSTYSALSSNHVLL